MTILPGITATTRTQQLLIQYSCNIHVFTVCMSSLLLRKYSRKQLWDVWCSFLPRHPTNSSIWKYESQSTNL